MMKNADCTLYHYENGKYTKRVYKNVYWQYCKASNVLKSGLQNADAVVLFVYENCLPIMPQRDIFVKGVSDFEFDNSSEKTISEGVKHIRENCEYMTVTTVDDYMYGGLPHIEISGK